MPTARNVESSNVIFALGIICCIIAVVNGYDECTTFCLDKASNRDCFMFNGCCDYRYAKTAKSTITGLGGNGKKNENGRCISLFGKIMRQNSECGCVSSTPAGALRARRDRTSKVDIVAAVILLFVVDMLLLSFTI